ncbi:MAG: hypothetical protein HY537_07325 [Deltaproteobacteria bacterium]|nr:hypothetical protein [Deltaproteobacteria bacterium]
MSSTNKEQRKFYVIVGLVLLSLGVWKILKSRYPAGPILLMSGLLIFAIEFIFRTAATRLFSWWMVFAQWLGMINTKVLLTLVYFLFLVPTVFLKNIFAKPSPYSSDQCRKRRSAWFALPRQDSGYENPY